MSLKEALDRQPLGRSRKLITYDDIKSYERLLSLRRSNLNHQFMAETGLDQTLIELLRVIEDQFPDTTFSVGSDLQSDQDYESSTYGVTWDYQDQDTEEFQVTLAKALYITTRIPTREIIIQGNQMELLTEDQWRSGEVLEDAIIRAFKNPKPRIITKKT